MPRCAQPFARDRVTLLAKLGLAEAVAVELDHVSAERIRTEARVLVGFGAAKLVIHVHRRHAVAEAVESVPEAGGVGAAGYEAANRAARLDQLMRTDEGVDPVEELHQKMRER